MANIVYKSSIKRIIYFLSWCILFFFIYIFYTSPDLFSEPLYIFLLVCFGIPSLLFLLYNYSIIFVISLIQNIYSIKMNFLSYLIDSSYIFFRFSTRFTFYFIIISLISLFFDNQLDLHTKLLGAVVLTKLFSPSYKT